MKKQKLNIVELFAGVGAPQMELSQRFETNTLFISEWNIYSIIAYSVIHHNKTYKTNKEKIKKEEINNLKEYLIKNYSNYNNQTGKYEPTLSRNGSEPLSNYNLTNEILINLVSALKSINNLGDITKINAKPYNNMIDLLWHSSPCQSFSHAGKGLGGKKGSGTSSSLLYDSLRIIEETKPKFVIWENVSGALSPKHIDTFYDYLSILENMGYSNSYVKIKGTDLGHVQTRPRVFAVSVLEGEQIDLSNIIKNNYKKIEIEDVIDLLTDGDMPSSKTIVYPRNELSSKYSAILQFIKKEEPNIKEPSILKDVNNFKEIYKYWSTNYVTLRATNEHLKYEEKMNNFISRYDLTKMPSYFFDSNMSPSRLAKATIGYTGTLVCSQRMAKYSKYTKKTSLLTKEDYWKLMGFDLKNLKLIETEIPKTEIFKICGNSVMLPQIHALFNEIDLENKLTNKKTSIS